MRLTGEKALARAGWLLAVVWIGLGAGMLAQAKAAPAATKAAPANTICIADASPPIPAETALNKKEYSTAESLFRGLLEKSPGNEAAHEGLIRTLIGQDKVAAAAIDAEAWAAAVPGSSMAWTALGDVRFRQGEPREAIHQYQVAIQLSLCNARDYYGLARVDGLAGFNATRKRLVEQAYAIHPTDDDIYRAWMATRERKEWLEKWTDYSENSDQIGDEDRTKLKDRLSKESLYHASDCRMARTSPPEGAAPMSAIMDGPDRFVAWGLDAKFNGKSRRLEIDTGASGITISRAAALFLGIKREDITETGGIGDKARVKTSIAHVASIKIGNMEFTNCPVEILEKWSVLESDGLIGGDVFADSVLTLDFPKRELRVGPLPLRPGETTADREREETAGDDETIAPHDPYIAPEMAKWLRVYRSDHELLMPTDLVDTKRMKDRTAWKDRLFLLDTGSESNLISPSAAREVTKVQRDVTSEIMGIQGEVNQVYEAGKFTLVFAGLQINSPSMTSIDTTKLSHDASVEVSGLIGAPALTLLVLHIDYRDNLVLFEYTPK